MAVDMVILVNKDMKTQLTLKHSLKELVMLKKLVALNIQLGI